MFFAENTAEEIKNSFVILGAFEKAMALAGNNQFFNRISRGFRSSIKIFCLRNMNKPV